MATSKKEILIFLGIAVLFVVLHLPALHHPYHQDEYKWPMIVNPQLTEPGGIPHPPVGEFIYRQAGFLIGYDNFRIVPFVFGLLNLFLVFYLVKTIFDAKTALFATGLFSVSFYSLLASLMVDTDGAIMPFFFLISAISYYKLKVSNFEIDKTKWKWSFLLILSVVLGFLVKVSFLIGVFALVLDFAFEKNIFADRRKILKYFCIGVMFVVGFILILIASRFIFPFFDLSKAVKYWEHFINSSGFFNRGWMQTFIQFAKSILYLSPLLVLPVFFADKEIWRKTQPFFFFIFIGILFYLFAFDFSIGALDRYFQFLVIPLCVISGAAFAKVFGNKNEKLEKYDFITVSLITTAIFILQFFIQFAPPLYPKTEWILRVISLKWNFLFPFTGGSGPTGFYVSFLFMALIWICSVVFGLSYLKIKNVRKRALFCILILGVLYNGVFVEEYLFGSINGSPYGLFKEVKFFIAENDNIKKVLVYNDIGGYEIQKLGKYGRRLYAAPQFEQTYKEFFKTFSGHVLYIDIPRIGEHNFYADYLNSCKEIYEEKDGYITAKILDCHK